MRTGEPLHRDSYELFSGGGIPTGCGTLQKFSQEFIMFFKNLLDRIVLQVLNCIRFSPTEDSGCVWCRDPAQSDA